MKKSQFVKTLTDYITLYKLQFFFAVLCLVAGTVIGSLSAISLSNDKFDSLSSYMQNFVSAYTLQPIDRTEIFTFSLYNNIKILLFLWISGFWAGLIPLGLLQLASKGYKLGFTTVFMIQLFRGSGVLFTLVSIIPQLLFLIPALIMYAVFNMNFSLTLRRMRQSGQSIATNKEMYLRNFLFLLVTAAVLILCSLLDAFVIPPVLKPICSFLCR